MIAARLSAGLSSRANEVIGCGTEVALSASRDRPPEVVQRAPRVPGPEHTEIELPQPLAGIVSRRLAVSKQSRSGATEIVRLAQVVPQRRGRFGAAFRQSLIGERGEVILGGLGVGEPSSHLGTDLRQPLKTD